MFSILCCSVFPLIKGAILKACPNLFSLSAIPLILFITILLLYTFISYHRRIF